MMKALAIRHYKARMDRRNCQRCFALDQSGRRDLTRPAASAAGAGLGPASGAEAPQAPKLNPRPPEPHAAQSAILEWPIHADPARKLLTCRAPTRVICRVF